MIHLGLTQPRLDSEAVSVLLDQLRTRLTQQIENPDQFFSRELSKTIFGNPIFHPLEVRDLEKVNIDTALEFIRSCQNPADYAFVFTGSLDAGVMRPLIETYLASVPMKVFSFDDWADVDYMRPVKVQREVFKGREQRSSVCETWFTPMEFTDEASAAVAALDEYLNIVLNDEIRESLGGVYSISAWVSLSPLPRGELSGGFYFICNPERAADLAAAAVEKIREVALGRIDEDILAKSREALIMGQEQSVQSNLYIAQSYANSAVIYNSPLSRLDRRPELYQAVSAEDLQNIAVLLINGGSARMILYPEE